MCKMADSKKVEFKIAAISVSEFESGMILSEVFYWIKDGWIQDGRIHDAWHHQVGCEGMSWQ